MIIETEYDVGDRVIYEPYKKLQAVISGIDVYISMCRVHNPNDDNYELTLYKDINKGEREGSIKNVRSIDLSLEVAK